MKRLSILGAAVLAALFAVESLAWDFLYSTPLGGRWVRSDNPLQVEEYDHRSEARLSPLVEELGENQWRLYTVWNRTEYTCVDGSVAFPDGYDRTVYSPKTNALALAAHKADTSNPHSVTSRQADEAGGTMNGAGAVMAMYGVGADKTNGVSLLDGNEDAIDFKYDRWVHAGDRDFWFISTNATWDFRTLGRPMWFGAGLATTGEVAEVESTASAALSTASTHAGNTNNPHQVTAAQIGALTAETDPVWTEEKTGVWEAIGSLSNEVGNVLSAEADPVWGAASNAVLTDISNLRLDVDALSGGASNSISTVASNLAAHVAATDNPHQVTAAQAGALPTGWTNAAAALNVTGALTLGGETRTNWPGTNTFTEAYPYNGRWVVDDPVGFESDVTFIENVEANTIHAEDIVMNGGSGNISVTNGATLTLGETADKVRAIQSWEDLAELFLPLVNLGANTVLSGGLTIKNSGSRSAPPIDVVFERANLTLGGVKIRSWGDITAGVEDQIADVANDLAAHESDHANPHGVTAAQVGALPVVGGTLADGARIYFGDGNHSIGKTDGNLEILSNGNIVLDGGATVVNGSLEADSLDASIVEADRVTIAGVTVTNWNNLPESAANAAHRADTDNPHQVTIAQLDEDEAVAEHLGETYGLHMNEADGVGPIAGYGHYISPEENMWDWNNGEDLVFASPSGTVDFQTDGVPTFHGTNLATMTDLSVSVAELASYSWVRSQIASATAGNFASLAAFNAHTNDANAHGLGALRATVAALPTEARVSTLIEDAIGDLGDVATQDDLANYVPGAVYLEATNALWGAFAGMATDADISAATNGLATASSVTALDGRVTVLESAAFGPDGVDVSSLANDLVDVEDRVSVAESDIADLQDIAGAAWPTNPAADQRVVFPKMHYYQNENDRPVIDPGFYDQGIAPHRSGAISNLALLQASKVEAGKMMVHGDPVLASTQFSSNYIAGSSVISMPRTFTATNDTLWCHYNYPDYIGKLHFVWSNAWYTEVVTNYTVVTNGGTVTTNETTATVTNHYQPSVSLTISGTNAANEAVDFNLIPRLDGTDQELYIDRTPLYLIKGFYIKPSMYPIPAAATDPVLIGFWYERPATYGEEFDLYGKVLMVDEPAEARGVANKGYVDDLVGGVDLSAIYNRDKTTRLNGHDLVLNPRYTVTWSNNDMTIGYGGFPVMTFKGGMRVEPCMTALTPRGTTIYAYCSGTAASEIRLEWCTNTLASAGMPFEDVPAERIIAQYMSDEYTWCTEIDGTGISACWMRAWLTSLTQALTDVELVTEDGPQSMAELFAKVAELHAATNLYARVTDLAAHTARQDNPHHVTAAQIGALTSESDTAALAALAAASNHFESAIADIGDNLPGLADFAARLAALEAWKNGSQSGGITSNEVFTGVSITVLTNLGETAWTDVAIASETETAVFVGDSSFIWEERVNNNKTVFTNFLPKYAWKSVAIGDSGNMALALPGYGRALVRTAKTGAYVQDTGSVRYAYWDVGAMAGDGSFGAVSGTKGLWTVTSNKVWRAFTNEASGTLPEYGEAFAADTGDILFSGDRSGQRRFALARSAQSVITGQLPLPAGVSTNARVVTRMPHGANRAVETASGTDDWPAALNATNTFVYKVTGGPWLDVMVDGTTPHPLYVRELAKWQENTYAKIDTGARQVVTNWTETDTFRGFYKKYRYRDGNNVWILLPQHRAAPEEYNATGYKIVWVPDDLDEWDLGTLGSDDYRLGDPDRYVVCTDTSNVNTAEGYINYDRTSYGYQTYRTATVVTNPVVSQTSTSSNRLVEAYEPITAAGVRCWVDAAVSMDPEMRRIWAVEADGHVWRMTGTSWRTGTWTSQAGPGTNMWTMVVCNADGSRAIAVGDCMVPTGATYGTGADAVPLEANAWYFDGNEWHALAHPVRKLDGTVGCVKWKKAYISQTGYTAYLLPEGTGYVHKMAYH